MKAAENAGCADETQRRIRILVTKRAFGVRFRAECSLAGKVYDRPFGVDVAFGDPILDDPDVMLAEDALAFAGIPLEDAAPALILAGPGPQARGANRMIDAP